MKITYQQITTLYETAMLRYMDLKDGTGNRLGEPEKLKDVLQVVNILDKVLTRYDKGEFFIGPVVKKA